MDEEHEATYKSEQVPRYHARETAIERARIEGASVVLGSATPSLEAFCRVQKGHIPTAAPDKKGKRAADGTSIGRRYARRAEKWKSFYYK